MKEQKNISSIIFNQKAAQILTSTKDREAIKLKCSLSHYMEIFEKIMFSNFLLKPFLSQNAVNNAYKAGPKIVWLLMYAHHGHLKKK